MWFFCNKECMRKEFIMSKKKKRNRHSNNPADKRAAKKAAVIGTEKKGPSPLIYILVFGVLLIGGVVFFASQQVKDVPFVEAPADSTASGTQITYPAGQFDDGKAQHFRYSADDGITIKYFVLESSDGVIRAAFDACDVCWRAGKGYYQSGDVMVCRNCGREFASVLVNEVKGGCNPAPLRRKLDGDKVVIEIADILAGKQYFDFSTRS
jgi:uncharacterized membrane protein